MQEIILNAPSATAHIYVGDECLNQRLPMFSKGEEKFVLTDSNVYALYPDFFEKYFKDVPMYVLTAGEVHKNFQSLEGILKTMAKAGLHRKSCLYAVGGGVIGDIGGLAASLYMRGISCVQIPTTLLAQVDSSVGGKTAVDLEEIKNIVGAFYQPQEVLVCPQFLKTLPQREIKCGLGEMIKYALLDADIFDQFQTDADWTSVDFLLPLIAKCIHFKAGVVSRDEKETGERKCLNVGHTTGHAVEMAYGFSHGEGVLYGAWLETYVAIEHGVCERSYGENALKMIERGLRLFSFEKADFSEIDKYLVRAKLDKKNETQDVICMSVAKNKGTWTIMSLPFDEYVAAIKRAVEELQRQFV